TAARLARELVFGEPADDLAAAFDRFLAEPSKDKGCVAKTEIARSLHELEEPCRELFLAGSRHVQPEPAFGGSVDAAAELRGICAHGLFASGHHRAVLEVVRLLADPEWRVRAEAARALSGGSRLEAEPVLRLKALSGDDEPDVVSECFGALLHLAREDALEFVAGFLDPRRAVVAQAAALALGESRLEGAVEALTGAYGTCSDPDLRRTLLLAVAMTRREPAFDYLFQLLENARPGRAAEALAALAIHRHDESLTVRAEKIVRERGDSELRAVFKREF
ncbi:MAG: HEAT repeat domain-containing protein, partial [Thermoanaerobaculia bacterium]